MSLPNHHPRRWRSASSLASGALMCTLAALAMGCPSGDPPSPPKTAAAKGGGIAAERTEVRRAASAPTAAPLEAVTLGPLGPEEKGGTLVVLLHGWGAAGDDLVGLARALARPGTRFVVPAAPLSRPGGGRAWWQLDERRPAQAWTAELPPDHQPHPGVAAARAAVQALLRDVRQRHAPKVLALAGFSQGAMLALDVAIAGDPPVDRVAALSGVLLRDSLPALLSQRGTPLPSVLIAHGRADSVVPFRGGQSMEALLEPRGYRVTWVPFDGGHEIPPSVVQALRTFLVDAPP